MLLAGHERPMTKIRAHSAIRKMHASRSRRVMTRRATLTKGTPLRVDLHAVAVTAGLKNRAAVCEHVRNRRGRRRSLRRRRATGAKTERQRNEQHDIAVHKTAFTRLVSFGDGFGFVPALWDRPCNARRVCVRRPPARRRGGWRQLRDQGRLKPRPDLERCPCAIQYFPPRS